MVLLRRSGPTFLAHACLLVLLGTSAARAVPVDYTIVSGTAIATAQVGLVGAPIGNFVFPSVSGTVRLDSVTRHMLSPLTITLGSPGLVVLSVPYGGYDEITVLSATISDGSGPPPFTSLPLPPGPTTVRYVASPIVVSSTSNVDDSSNTNPPITNFALTLPPSSMTVSVQNGAGVTVNLSALTFLEIPAAVTPVPPADPNSLFVIGSVAFTAIPTGGGIPVPEPSGIVLLGIGLAVAGIGSWKTLRSRS